MKTESRQTPQKLAARLTPPCGKAKHPIAARLNTPKSQMTSNYPYPQMLIPHQFASVQPKYMLQSLPSLMVQGQAQRAYGHNVWKTASPPQQAMPALLSSPA